MISRGRHPLFIQESSPLPMLTHYTNFFFPFPLPLFFYPQQDLFSSIIPIPHKKKNKKIAQREIFLVFYMTLRGKW
jgi:hypothetical protein